MPRKIKETGKASAIELSEKDLRNVQGCGASLDPGGPSMVRKTEEPAPANSGRFPIYYDPSFESRLG